MMSNWGDERDEDYESDAYEAEVNDELAFDESEESLPWLESDEEEEPAGFDASRLVGIGLLMLAALVILVGAIWWVGNRASQSGPEPDGSLIAAPEEPYKTRPEDEGGKTFEGTGDTSFAVGEGQTREGRLAESTEAATAAMAANAGETSTETTSTPAPTPSPTQAAQSSSSGDATLPTGTAVQVGAFPTREAAEAGWRTLTRQTEALSGVRYRVIRGQADIGTVYRLQAVGGDNANANRLCTALKADGLPCLVK